MSYLPSNVTDCIYNAEIALEKSALLLGDLTTEYSFSDRPIVNMNGANREAFKLIYEYNRLITFMEMAHDYVFKAQKLLEHAEKVTVQQEQSPLNQPFVCFGG